MHGQFIWYELTTPDVEAAQKFYPRFTGWGTQSFDKDYTMWTTGGVPLAGLFRLTDEMRQQGVPPNWMAYVETTDVDETATKARSLGGRVVVEPADIPGTGRFAVLQDPQGAVLGIYKSTSPMGAGAWDGTPVVGRFSWHELMTTDYKTAFEFYRELFGWEQMSEMDMGGGMMYSLFGKNGQMYGGMFNQTGDMLNMAPFWLLYINVPDVGKAVTTATKAGGKIHRPQIDIPGGSIAILGDPQGAGFALHHVNPPAEAGKPAAKKAPSAGKKGGAAKSKKPATAAKGSKSKAKAKAKSAGRPAKRQAAKGGSAKGGAAKGGAAKGGAAKGGARSRSAAKKGSRPKAKAVAKRTRGTKRGSKAKSTSRGRARKR